MADARGSRCDRLASRVADCGVPQETHASRQLWHALLETGHITASILFLITAASIYSRMLGLAGLPNELGDLLTQTRS